MNGTTYAGRRARTTGAPQNHWFGPAGTPLAGGIGTIEAIRLVWSCHRKSSTIAVPRRDGPRLRAPKSRIESDRIIERTVLCFTTLIVRTHARCYRYCYENGTYTVRRRARLFKEVIVTVPHHPSSIPRLARDASRVRVQTAPVDGKRAVASFTASDDTRTRDIDARRRNRSARMSSSG